MPDTMIRRRTLLSRTWSARTPQHIVMLHELRQGVPVDARRREICIKYLDLLMKLKETGQTAKRCKRELTNIAEFGKSELHQTANLKAAYMRARVNSES